MQKKKRQETKGDAAPSICVLALAANNSDNNDLKERRIRERLEAKPKLIESIASPSCESTGVDTGLCPKSVAELYSWQRKKQRSQHSHSNVVKLDDSVDILPNNSVLVRNPSVCATDNVKSWPNSKVTPKKKRSKQKRRNSVESDKATVQSETANFATCCPVDKDLVSPLPVNSFPKEDSEMKNDVEGYYLSGNRNETLQKSKKHILAEIADVSPDLEARCCRPTFDVTNICSPLKSDGKPVPAVDSMVNVSLMENHDDDEGVTNVLSEMKIQRTDQRTCRIRGVKTYGRKRKKVLDFPIVDSKSIQEDTSSLALFVQDRMGNTALDHSAETLSGGCTKDLNEKKLVRGQGSLLQVVEDVILEKVVDGCTDVESLVMENERNMDMDNSKEKTNERSMDMDNSKEKTTEGCLDKDMPLVDSLNQNFEQSERAKPDHFMDMQDDSTISRVGKEFGDESGKTVPDEPVNEHANPSLSDLTNSRDGTIQVDKDVNFSLERSRIRGPWKKLLVLDINGLLADIVQDVPNRYTPEAVISGKAVFKRPYCDDFLQFCFTRFSVGVWSSRMKRNVGLILDFLMGDAKKKLLFCWDQTHCTETGFNTVENREKPLLVKKLKKLWKKYEGNLPWERGDYNETNTLLLDDSPHKALGNPPHTAIFPHSYRFTDEEDNSLGPGGALRLYLEGVANAENVQKYVEENPFGQRPITEKNLSWRFYCKVIEAISSASSANRYSRENLQWRAYR